jgi:hypothetical protein
MNLQEAKLLRAKDKKFDWGKIKKVRLLCVYGWANYWFIELQADQRGGADSEPQ